MLPRGRRVEEVKLSCCSYVGDCGWLIGRKSGRTRTKLQGLLSPFSKGGHNHLPRYPTLSFSDEYLERFIVNIKEEMHTVNAPQPTPRKNMRKGTHSCYECRRRKVRCIFAKDSAACEGCTARGKRCTEQSRELLQDAALETRESLRERVARLEAIIKASSSARRTPGHSEHVSQSPQTNEISSESSTTSIANTSTPSSLLLNNTSISIAGDSPQSVDPIVTLFDNAIVSAIS